jgi:hypothetical protein
MKKKVRENRNVVVKRNLCAAMGATGTGRDNGFSNGNPVDAHIQEASDHEAQKRIKNKQAYLHGAILRD